MAVGCHTGEIGHWHAELLGQVGEIALHLVNGMRRSTVTQCPAHDTRAFKLNDDAVIGGIGPTGGNRHLRPRVKSDPYSRPDFPKSRNRRDTEVFLGYGIFGSEGEPFVQRCRLCEQPISVNEQHAVWPLQDGAPELQRLGG
jgi:hypothetical protein